MPCSCVGMSCPEVREAIALGVAGIQEMSMALGFDCASCLAPPPVEEAPRRSKDAPPVTAYGHLTPLYLRRN